jgi:hypothetical protein
VFTTFRPAGGGPGITVAVQAGAPPSIAPSELERRRCERVSVGGLTGMRCVDTVSSIVSTMLAGKAQTYIIATTAKDVEQPIYQRFLDSFSPI